MGLDGENKYFIFRDEDTSLRRTFKWNLLHANNETICRFTCKTTYVCLGGGGVSDGREMPNFYFGTVSLVLHLV